MAQNFCSPVASSSGEHAPTKESSQSKPLNSADGHNSSERFPNIIQTPSDQWLPQQAYEEVSIGDLCPGLRRVVFTCRIINIHNETMENKMPQLAKACLKILVRDDSATILIKLWYATTSHNLRLGTLLTCWTTHVHSTSSIAGINEAVPLPSASIETSIFPERDSGCHLQIHNEEGRLGACCRTPLGYFMGDSLPGLMSLDHYINGASGETPGARLMVCVVAVDEPTTNITKSGTKITTIDVSITDRSCSATLSLSQPLLPSAQSWTKNQSILLISFPKLHTAGRICLTLSSQVDVDPSITEAIALRRNIQQENSPINQPFPQQLFDVDAIQSSPQRLQFTFATLSEYIDAQPDHIVAGYISVILSQVNLTELSGRKQLFSMDCCSVPIYSNKTVRECGRCGKKVQLRINPNVVGSMADETGGIAIFPSPQSPPPKATSGLKPSMAAKKQQQQQHNKLLWSDEAWQQLLGRGTEELADFCRDDVSPKTRNETANVLRYLEQRLLWMRVVLLVGWTGEAEGGKLAVLRVVA